MNRLQPGIFAVALVGTALASGGCSAYSPRQSEDKLRANLLDDVPLGSSMEQVRQQIGRLGWPVEVTSLDSGFHDQRVREFTITGSQYIEAYAGHYQGFPWRADVSVYWAFDRDGQLVDVWVWKTFDSI